MLDICSHIFRFLGTCVPITGLLGTCVPNLCWCWTPASLSDSSPLDSLYPVVDAKPFCDKMFATRSAALSFTPCNTFGTRLLAIYFTFKEVLPAGISLLRFVLFCDDTFVICCALSMDILWQYSNQFVIFSPWKVPWNWIAFDQNSFVVSPGLLYHLIRCGSGRLANEAFTSNFIVSSKQ